MKRLARGCYVSEDERFRLVQSTTGYWMVYVNGALLGTIATLTQAREFVDEAISAYVMEHIGASDGL